MWSLSIPVLGFECLRSFELNLGCQQFFVAVDGLLIRTNENAGISVITGLAFVAFAGLCITYQD